MKGLNELENAMVGNAFDRAWDAALREGILETMDVDMGRRLIATTVLRLFNDGEKDEWRLSRGALTQFRLYKLLMTSKPRAAPRQAARLEKGVGTAAKAAF